MYKVPLLPMCVNLWILNACVSLNPIPQIEQLKLLTPVLISGEAVLDAGERGDCSLWHKIATAVF